MWAMFVRIRHDERQRVQHGLGAKKRVNNLCYAVKSGKETSDRVHGTHKNDKHHICGVRMFLVYFFLQFLSQN
jgi:hypothetical protein